MQYPSSPGPHTYPPPPLPPSVLSAICDSVTSFVVIQTIYVVYIFHQPGLEKWSLNFGKVWEFGSKSPVEPCLRKLGIITFIAMA